MNFIFKITTFHKNQFGTEEKIDNFCTAICEIAKEKEYSTKIDRIDVIPDILPDELLQQGFGEEFTKIELKYRLVAMARQINFDVYQTSDLQGRKTLLVECLVEALREVKKKFGFDIDAFEQDIRSLL